MGFLKITQKLIGFNDGNVDRAQMGELPAYTDPRGHTAPAGSGMRTVDAQGNLIFDSSAGLVDQLKSLGFMAGGSSQSVVGSGAGNFTEITGSGFNFSVSRPKRIDYRVFVTGFISAGAGSGHVRGVIEGFDNTADIIQGTAGNQSGFIWYFTGPGANFLVLPPAGYRVHMEMSADAATTYRCVQFFHQIFDMGG